MRVAVKAMVPVWVEIDLKEKTVDKVTVDATEIGKPLEYRVILPDGSYDSERFAGRKMAKSARRVFDWADVDWPKWDVEYFG